MLARNAEGTRIVIDMAQQNSAARDAPVCRFEARPVRSRFAVEPVTATRRPRRLHPSPELSMNLRFVTDPASLLSVAGTLALVTLAGCASTLSDTTSGSQDQGSKASAQDMKLPPGWTQADMDACMAAGTPGKMHEQLAKNAGTWMGKCQSWMAPGMDPTTSDCTSKITPFIDGRFVKVEVSGEMPGMGPFTGFGINGFDNVSQKYVSVWLDNFGTGIMNGTGVMSSDGKTLTWTYTYNCPILKKATTVRQVEKYSGSNAMTLEIFCNDPKSGKEFKSVHIDFTKSSS
jgi:hypothetical protein